MCDSHYVEAEQAKVLCSGCRRCGAEEVGEAASRSLLQARTGMAQAMGYDFGPVASDMETATDLDRRHGTETKARARELANDAGTMARETLHANAAAGLGTTAQEKQLVSTDHSL